jgi:hypothetical protein
MMGVAGPQDGTHGGAGAESAGVDHWRPDIANDDAPGTTFEVESGCCYTGTSKTGNEDKVGILVVSTLTI